MLLLGSELPLPDDAQVLEEARFVAVTDRILALLAACHDFPKSTTGAVNAVVRYSKLDGGVS
ncbi:hypothetical protein IHE31_01835 (plasmid) [Mycetohabitans rhizoxinica]|uniref:Uncharacterized protein n=2 Tax=Mycetohabitans rhizoxinica TaxID=412963 RepID=E5AUQ4_MYCRK|nr:hypothetical protein [Mycetohabitans sp. B2]MCG1048429.1 hypothetical protein [Mycetohabitans sp. B6]CBW76828.1 Hypothetical protein RBRH_00305 [Mycetohabitans rhizoxinica HKI 454]